MPEYLTPRLTADHAPIDVGEPPLVTLDYLRARIGTPK